MKKYVYFIIAIVMSLMTLTACTGNNNKSIFKSDLETPANVQFKANYVVWDKVKNADSYEVILTYGKVKTSIIETDNSFVVDIKTIGDYSVQIVAKDSTNKYNDSEPSKSVTFHRGSGDKDDPILVDSIYGLNQIGTGFKTIKKEEGKIENIPLYYKMIGDIDLGCIDENGKIINNWNPIGVKNNVEDSFQGVFDGNGHCITGLGNNKLEIGYAGLFGKINNGVVKNLTIKDSKIKTNLPDSTYRIGMLAGWVQNSSSDCNTIINNCKIENCVIDVVGLKESGEKYIGGLVGYSNKSEIYNCSVVGSNITTEIELSYVGGLIGNSMRDKLMYNYSADTNITVNKGYKNYIGGLIGRIRFDESVLENSFSRNTVNVKNTETNSDKKVGGLIGFVYGSVDIKNCYSASTLNIDKIIRNMKCGFIGYVSSQVYTSGCLYDYKALGLGDTEAEKYDEFDVGDLSEGDPLKLKGHGIKGVYFRTTEEMKNQETYTYEEDKKVKFTYDFDKIWVMNSNVNNGYPMLRNNIEIEGKN